MSDLFNTETGEVREPEGEVVQGCAGCARRDAVIETVTADVRNLEREVKKHLRRIAALDAELKQQRQEAPEGQAVRALYGLWVRETKRNPKQTKLGEKREKAVLKMVRLFPYEDVADAIRGGARFCYVAPDGRRFDDLELICRNEVNIERFRDQWRRFQASLTDPSPVPT